MESITELTKIDFTTLFISVFVILVGIKVIISLLEWFIKCLGLETKWMRNRRKEHDLIIKTASNLELLQKKHNIDMEKSDQHDKEMSENIKKLTDMFVQKQISDYRWEIINLADKITSGKSVSKECYKHAITTYETYEKIIHAHGLLNGEVELSIEIIKENYQKRLKEGF